MRVVYPNRKIITNIDGRATAIPTDILPYRMLIAELGHPPHPASSLSTPFPSTSNFPSYHVLARYVPSVTDHPHDFLISSAW